jgi:hypothetical protein
MTKAEWRAVYDYCEYIGLTKAELLRELQNNGTIDRGATLEDIGDYVRSNTYDDMIRFLEENL